MKFSRIGMLQKISKPAKKMLLLASTVCFGVVATAVFMAYNLVQNTILYTEQLELAASVTDREEAVSALYQLVADTHIERKLLNDSFLGVVGMAQFLEQIEQYAANNQLELESGQIQQMVSADEMLVSEVRVPYRVSGLRNDVLQFIDLLEQIPYHGFVEQLQLETTQASPNQVSANVVVVLSYRQYD